MKKIIIFSSIGGGGHTAVANALREYLQDEYQVEIINIFSEVIKPLSTVLSFSPKKFDGEDIYNYSIANKWYGFLNYYYKAGAYYFKLRQTRVEESIDAYIKQKKPDLIISVVPLINNILLHVTQLHNIPFLLVPTDLDITTFIFDIKNPSYNKFRIALPFDDQQIYKKISEAQIPQTITATTGFTIRPDFFESKDKNSIKRFYGIPQNKPVVLILLGAVGLQSVDTFAKHLCNLKTSAHLLLCIGRQLELKDRLEMLPFPPNISTTIIQFTNRISDLMAVSDILITKSGSVSVCEALYMNLPVILDATPKSLLNWEKYNHQFIKNNNFGTTLTKFEDLPDLIEGLLSQHINLKAYKENLSHFEKKHGGSQIKNLIQEII